MRERVEEGEPRSDPVDGLLEQEWATGSGGKRRQPNKAERNWDSLSPEKSIDDVAAVAGGVAAAVDECWSHARLASDTEHRKNPDGSASRYLSCNPKRMSTLTRYEREETSNSTE